MPDMAQEDITLAVSPLLHGLDELPVPVERIANEKLHIELIWESFPEEPDLSGMLVRQGSRAFIAVNAAQSVTRQRFTIAHEIGHYLLDEVRPIWVDKNIRPIQVSFRRGSGGTPRSYQWPEVRANRFAAELLMPTKWVKHEFAALDSTGVDWSDEEPIRLLADRFGASLQAMVIRLLELRLLLETGAPE